MSDKKIADYLSKYLTTICLSTIVLIGLCVIIGWHLRIPLLIRVIPNAIAMQYNTALCFLLLAGSAWAMTANRLPHFFTAVGGGVVGLFGLLVIFQYATGISLGIDTLFFYPWERTLSADPGRMALTSAICFAVSGTSLSLLILRPKTLSFFILAHTFPLSLGVTSLLGYIFGITYVLPFRLGSQMAVHTAFAFTVYGGAMLFYAWQKIPQTRRGLPEWGPLISIVMAPVFFISLSSSFQDSSLTARIGQLFLAACAIGMLVLAMYKVIHARIVYKGLILITIPLLFVLGFVLLVNQQKHIGEQADVLELKTQEIIENAHTLFQDLLEIHSGIRGYVITADKNYLESYEEAISKIQDKIQRLKTQASDDPQKLARAEALANIAQERITVAEELKKLVDNGKQSEAIAYVKSGVGKRVMDEFRDQLNIFLAEEERKDQFRRKEIQNSWQQFDRLLVGGVAANLFLALTLVFLFTRGIGYRLQALSENAKAIAAGQLLSSPLTGSDEIAQLDQNFHQMARELQKARYELELKVEERTRELSQTNEILREQIAERRKAEEDLAAQRSFLRQVIDLNPNFIFAKDRDGRFTLANQAVAEAYGTTVENLLGKTDADFNAGKKEVDRFRQDDLEVIDRRIEKFIPEESVTDADGKLRWLQTVKRPIYNPDGTVSQLLGVATDITDRKWVAEEIKKINESLEQRVIERTAQLEAAVRRESLMIENALDVICTIDAEGKFVTVNPASLKVWGYRPEELIGRRYIELVAPEDVPKTNEAALNIMSGEMTTNFENCYQHKDGSRVNILWAAYWSNSEQLMFCVARDITERKRWEELLRKSEERFNLIARATNDTLWDWNLLTNELWWNENFYEMFGYDEDEIEPTVESWTSRLHPEDAERVGNGIHKLIEKGGETWTDEYRFLRADGSYAFVIDRGYLVYDERGKPMRMLGTMMDITERKLSEDKIRQLNENLEKQTIWLEAANKELESFSYSVSHDLRAPLRAIDGFSRILLEDYADKLDDEGRRVLDVIRKNAQNMGQLIDDLLAFSRLGRKQIEASTIDMGELARDVYTQLESNSGSHPNKIQIKSLPPAKGDRALLRQVFVNLISNAMKYSRNNASTEIEIGAEGKDGENIYFVRDNGVGFDMKYADKLFGVFQRLHGANEFEGTGVGLAIVQRIVHRHGGRVWAEAEVGKGATFYFTLPRNGATSEGEENEFERS